MAMTRSASWQRPRAEQRGEVEAAHGAEHRLDVAMRTRGDDLEALGGGHQGFAAQGTAHQVDDGVGQMGEVAERLVLDLGAVAEGSAQQVGGVDAAFVMARRGDDVDRSASAGHEAQDMVHDCQSQHNNSVFSDYTLRPVRRPSSNTSFGKRSIFSTSARRKLRELQIRS
jgi:hypothetical protein